MTTVSPDVTVEWRRRELTGGDRRYSYDLFRDGVRLGWIRPYELGTGYVVRVDGVPFGRPHSSFGDQRRANHRGLARSKAHAQKIILAALAEHEECKRTGTPGLRCDHGVRLEIKTT